MRDYVGRLKVVCEERPRSQLFGLSPRMYLPAWSYTRVSGTYICHVVARVRCYAARLFRPMKVTQAPSHIHG
jgi:hypothetical protein